jgi:hypothetical protein
MRFSLEGVAGSAFALGAFEVDAVTVAMTIALILGRGRFRPLAGIGLALITASLVAAPMWWW